MADEDFVEHSRDCPCRMWTSNKEHLCSSTLNPCKEDRCPFLYWASIIIKTFLYIHTTKGEKELG